MVWSGRRSGSWAHLEVRSPGLTWSLRGVYGAEAVTTVKVTVTDTDTSDSQRATDWFNPLCILYSFILACVFDVICWSQIVLFPMKWPNYCCLEDASRRWVLGAPRCVLKEKELEEDCFPFQVVFLGSLLQKLTGSSWSWKNTTNFSSLSAGRVGEGVICSLGFICAKGGWVSLEMQNHLCMVPFSVEGDHHQWSSPPFLWLRVTCSRETLILSDEGGGCYLVVGHGVIYAR